MRTLTKAELKRLESNGAKVTRKPKPKITNPISQRTEADKIHETNILRRTESDKLFQVVVDTTKMSIETVNNIQKTQLNMDRLIDALQPKTGNCKLKVNRNERGLIDTIDIIKL